jgi:hypothetical protein
MDRQASLSIDEYYKQDHPDLEVGYHHLRSDSRIPLFEPLRTKTETRIWLQGQGRPATLQLDQVDRGSIASRSSSAGYEDEKPKWVDDAVDPEDTETQKRMPFLIRPIHARDLRDSGATHEWLRVEDQSSEWLSLFYGMSHASTKTSRCKRLNPRPGSSSRPDSLFIHSRTLIPFGNLDVFILLHYPRLVMDISGPLRYSVSGRRRISSMLQNSADYRVGLHRSGQRELESWDDAFWGRSR